MDSLGLDISTYKGGYNCYPNVKEGRLSLEFHQAKLLSVDEGMDLYLCIEQVALEGSFKKVF